MPRLSVPSAVKKGMWITSTSVTIAVSGCAGLSVEERATSADLPEADSRTEPPGDLTLDKQGPAATPDTAGKDLHGPVDGLRADAPAQCGFGRYALRDLSAKSIALSYQDVEAAREMLTALGYTVLVNGAGDGDVGRSAMNGRQYSCNQLPVVMINAAADDGKLSIGAPRPVNTGVESGGGQGGYQSADQMDVAQGELSTIERSHSADVDRMLAFYHPEEPEVLSRLQSHIRYVVDAPAPQVYIEGWVLEISEEDSRELGIRYTEGLDDDEELSLGSTDGSEDALDFTSDDRVDAAGDPVFLTAEGVLKRIRAFVENEKAKILSRPSLLTLSNRQSVIQVVDVIQYPLLETTFQGLGNVTSGVQFGSLRIGITLNLRPRVSADRQWVSLEIDATVDAEDEENTGQAFQTDPETGERVLLAEKPGFNSRRVHTFARIPDRTPIIVGGLVSTEDSTAKQRVPWIGEIPYLGALFGFTDKDVTQREIMIVLTPYVLAEEQASVRTNAPKESAVFDDVGMELFDDRYRLRGEDVFDLSPIVGSERFARHELMAKRAIDENPSLLEDPDFAAFVGGSIPGGDALVDRTFFDLARKRGLDLELDPANIRISSIRDDRVVPSNLEDVLDRRDGDEAILITSGRDRISTGAHARIVDSDETTPEGAIRIQDKSDVLRLLSSVAARRLIAINGGLQNLQIRTLNAGQFIALPNFESDQGFSIDSETIRVYRQSSAYARIVDERLEEAYRAVASHQPRSQQAPPERTPRQARPAGFDAGTASPAPPSPAKSETEALPVSPPPEPEPGAMRSPSPEEPAQPALP